MRDLTCLDLRLKGQVIVERYHKNNIPSCGWKYVVKQQIFPKEEDSYPVDIKFAEGAIIRVPQTTIVVTDDLLRFKTSYLTCDDFLDEETMKTLRTFDGNDQTKVGYTIKKMALPAIICDVETSIGENCEIVVITIFSKEYGKKTQQDIKILDRMLIGLMDIIKDNFVEIIKYVKDGKSNKDSSNKGGEEKNQHHCGNDCK